MGTVSAWENAYYLIYTTSTTESPDFSTGTCLGTYGEGKPIMYLTSKPPIEKLKETYFRRKSTGRSYLIKGAYPIERIVNTFMAQASFETDLDSHNAFIPLITLFQTPSTGILTEDTKTFVPYTVSSVSNYASLLRFIETNSSQQIDGAVCRSVAFRGSIGSTVTMSMEWVGRTANMSAVGSTVTWGVTHCANALLFQNMKFAIDNSVYLNELIDFEIIITNNTVIRYYNNMYIKKFLTGDFQVTGSFKFPWNSSYNSGHDMLDKLRNGTDYKIMFWWGNYPTASEGDFSITLNVENDNVIVTEDTTEMVNEVNFTGIYDGTNLPVEIKMYFGDMYPSYSFHVYDAEGDLHIAEAKALKSDGTSTSWLPKGVLAADGSEYIVD